MSTTKPVASCLLIDTLCFNENEIFQLIEHISQENRLDSFLESIIIYHQNGLILKQNSKASHMLHSYGNPRSLPDLLSSMDVKLENSSFYIGDQFIVRCIKGKNQDAEYTLFLYIELPSFLESMDISLLTCLIKMVALFNQEKNENDLLLDSLFDLVTVADSDGNIIRTNSKIESVFGISKREIIGMNTANMVNCGLVTNSVTDAVLREKKSVTMTQETQKKRKLTVTGYPMFKPNGDIYRVLNISRDITELSDLEAKLQETETLIQEYENQISIFRKKTANPNLLITSSIKMGVALETIKNIINVDSTIMIEGETGVGKGVLARKIHDASARSNKPFVKINCGAIPENLIETELFGYEEGSFTGATKGGKRGLISEASGGTLFLDEISDLPLHLQVKILDLIQNKSFYPVGSVRQTVVDVRIITATNRDLKACVKNGLFREDLYYRLAVIPINVPPLRERIDEINQLTTQFLEKFSLKYNKSKIINRECLRHLERYTWPGNIRELEHLVERLVLTTKENIITQEDLPSYIRNSSEYRSNNTTPIEIKINRLVPLKIAYSLVEKAMLKRAFELHKSQEKVAEVLEIHRTTVSRKAGKFKEK